MTKVTGINKKILRRMKYSSDQQGILKRYLAEENNWEGHLEKTRSFITGCLEGSEAESLAILGSGWLLDIPLDYLAANFKSVYLIDIVHPPQIINKIKDLANIHPIQADITGGAIAGAYSLVENYRKTGIGSVLDIAFQASLAGSSADFIISLNILNQLDILLIDYMNRFMEIPEDVKAKFRRRIQSQHLELLTPGRSCLITDVEERILNRDNLVSTKQLIYAELPRGSRQEKWTWTFDTRGEYNKGHRTEMLVRAIQL